MCPLKLVHLSGLFCHPPGSASLIRTPDIVIIFIIIVVIIITYCCCLFCDKQHCVNFSYHSAPTLLQQLTNHIHPITSHCTDQAAYLCLSMLLLLHSTQPPPALVLLCLYAPWGVFISKLITVGGLLAMVPACYLSLCCEFHSATRYCYSRQLYQQGAIFPKQFRFPFLFCIIVYDRIKCNVKKMI